MQLFWDLPVTLHAEMYDAVNLAHHVGMAISAALSLSPYVQYWVPFFGGLIEASSIPLVLADVFHPKRYQDFAEATAGRSKANFLLRVTFLLAYLLVRCVWFPATVAFGVGPDLLSELRGAEDAAAALSPALALLLILPLTFLQLHWGRLLVRQAMKALAPPPDDKPAYDQLDDQHVL
ncbi:hypothetical protein EMIHUDRAFT_421470 [Emiliania huxleyi CCMP1516]|uniref:TLC domain-containing protein n=2 Tax=Emiliania huxleyi TaxID=2903 RepID=A0A0D3IX72_EMIH1|nr:hypothetical protein EMIHUDRAFT_425048 [Emiliania huxleyi CCMP1516]XP_005777109.1 hypothetical protein EMIHUDRAFT_421470 [Emiliania huxleyi CCMP1516]EOD15857.1 hypothetical protein EMIHUDRAFT_425048 [Emiliania huxleyi CCMP1516]EOD24680.1 hypothetical protein EMIHUDRAFT_421470 [Emiliania huxleyi CCMP1516]|eukprot:XP_005768286.1 hypothetical protein EMIHUDRAFT_425048 [Emiliania huxleyi CCMP1516]